MKIIKEEENKNYSIDTKKINIEDIPNLNNKISRKILDLISKKAMYPKQIAKKLNFHEQNIYYHIRKLEKSQLIKVEKQENINGTIANFYKITSNSFYFEFAEFKQSPKVYEKVSKYLEPFIKEGNLNALIIVGSPDPHGPQKARSKDGYFGMDLGLFLGTYLNYVPESKVKLDTEITSEDLKKNLIVIGGPIVNKVTSEINKNMKIYFDEEKKGVYSTITRKIYFGDEIGVINKFTNPFNTEGKILLLAGIRNTGTKATILAFLKHFEELKKGNQIKQHIDARVVEGIDIDSDGRVDDVEFLE